MSNYTKFIFLIFISILINSCAEHIVESTPSIIDKQNQDKVLAKFSSIQDRVLNLSCAVSGCHNGTTFPNLSEGGAYANIVGVTGSSGQNLIEPGDANNSYLYLKIVGASGIFGDQMPKGQDPLPGEVIDSIKMWIDNGALNN
ncbi:MAG: hypothetical protein HND52_13390 [Ignavibacteriae bacterium]|nr:hypothetical protein [Ignavibacteriota bacterium]NOG98947.1 hypothetical protein [Ignavibacteriota bacterium]